MPTQMCLGAKLPFQSHTHFSTTSMNVGYNDESEHKSNAVYTNNFPKFTPFSLPPFQCWDTLSHPRKLPSLTHVLHSIKWHQDGAILPESLPQKIHVYATSIFCFSLLNSVIKRAVNIEKINLKSLKVYFQGLLFAISFYNLCTVNPRFTTYAQLTLDIQSCSGHIS